MATGDIGSVIDTLEFDTEKGTKISTCHVSGNVYVTIYQSVDLHGHICTFSVDPAGEISNTVLDTWEFRAAATDWTALIKVTDGMFLAAYSDELYDGWVFTFAVAANGTITKSVIDDWEFDDVLGYPGNMLEVGDNVFSIVYCGPDGDGWVKTFSCSDAGTLPADKISELEFDIATGAEPFQCHISGIYYAVVYRGPGDDGWVKTFSCSTAGNLSASVISSKEFDLTRCYYPTICKGKDSYFAIAYEGNGSDGWLVIVEISSTGVITQALKDTYEFDISNGFWPLIIPIGEGYIAVAYSFAAGEGRIKTFLIDAAGSVNNTTIGSGVFDSTKGGQPQFIHVAGNTYFVVYCGFEDDGHVASFSIETAGVRGRPLVMMMGLL